MWERHLGSRGEGQEGPGLCFLGYDGRAGSSGDAAERRVLHQGQGTVVVAGGGAVPEKGDHELKIGGRRGL